MVGEGGHDVASVRSCDLPTCAGHRGKHPTLPVTNRYARLCVPVAQDFRAAPPEQGAVASLVVARPVPQQHPLIIIAVHLRWATNGSKASLNQQVLG